ncbi:MAG: ABC transporter permease [Nitrososphaerota archaeon]|nr:ABC transporter permease [Aigarchaeota archaeon]MDW8076713.1 ABC transporter permease [Nitrososphaerota archaeon]
MSIEWIEPVLASTTSISAIYLLGSLGEIYAERSGILNLGLEGIMAMGAAVSFIITIAWGHVPAFLISCVFGILMGLLLALFTVSLRLNQIAVGLAITMLGIGLSGFIAFPTTRKAILQALNPQLPSIALEIQSAPMLPSVPLPFLKDIPIIGPMFFNHNVVVYIALILAPLMWFLLFRTSIGLKIRSVGENPGMADALGINVFRIRYLTCMLSGVFSALAGAYLILGFQPFWIEGITGGRGFITLSLIILSTWSPLRAIFGSLLFGGIEVLQYRLQLFGLGATAPQFVLMLPYAIAVITLTLLSLESFRKRISAPAALAKPYCREE